MDLVDYLTTPSTRYLAIQMSMWPAISAETDRNTPMIDMPAPSLLVIRQLAVFLPSVRGCDSGTLRYLPAYLLAVRCFPRMSDKSGGLTRSCKLSTPILAGQNEDPYLSLTKPDFSSVTSA